MEKVCSKCGISKPVGEFYKRSARKDRLVSQCKACVSVRCLRYRASHKEKLSSADARRHRGEGPSGLLGRFKRLLNHHRSDLRKKGVALPNITPEELVEMWNKQAGRCAVTGRPITLLGRNTNLDHNHETGEVRGFVLHGVNAAEGRIKDFTREEWMGIYDFYRPPKKLDAV